MSTSLRRKLSALREMTTERGCTEHEEAAAQAAIGRLLARLGEAAETLVDREPPYVQPTRQRRARRTREPMQKVCLAVGDIVDCCDYEGTFSRCRCGSDRFAVEEGMSIATALLVCVRCKRSRMLHPWHFRPGGRWRQS